jgi:hypothetical protein
LQKPSNAGWWWNLTDLWDKCDLLCKILVNFLLGLSIALAVNIIPRLSAGGPNFHIAIIIVPTLLAWLFGKELFEQTSCIREFLERLLEALLIKFRIPIHFLDELCLLTAFSIFFLPLLIIFLCMNSISNFFYDQGVEQSGKDWLNSKSLVSAESNFKLATAFNPDNSKAYFRLGWLYELRQDLNEARNHYKIAMQNGSLIARVRLAGLLLRENQEKLEEQVPEENQLTSSEQRIQNDVLKVQKLKDKSTQQEKDKEKDKNGTPNLANTAAIILEQGRVQAEGNEFPSEDRLSWYIAIAWSRLQQKRYGDASDNLNMARPLFNDVKKQKESENKKPSTSFYCIEAELLEQKSKKEKALPIIKNKNKLKSGNANVLKAWGKCENWASPGDPDEDIWLAKAQNRTESK